MINTTSTNNTRVTFCTEYYRRSHPKGPAATTNGSWLFFFGGDRDPMNARYFGQGTFAELKKKAKAAAKVEGITLVELAP